MVNEAKRVRYCPMEITTQNLYFHEESPILSCDGMDNVIITSGYDQVIRIWEVIDTNQAYESLTYKTAADSSIKIKFATEFRGIYKPINCVRFKKQKDKYIAACGDGGKVMIYNGTNVWTIRKDDGNDAYELLWEDGMLFVGFADGSIEIYSVEEDEFKIVEDDKLKIPEKDKLKTVEDDKLKTLEKDKFKTLEDDKFKIVEEDTIDGKGRNKENMKETQNENDRTTIYDKVNIKNNVVNKKITLKSTFLCAKKIHKGTIQGMSYNKKYKLIATHSLDRTVKVHRVVNGQLVCLSIFDSEIDGSKGLFKRIFFDEDDLYVFSRGNIISVYSYPFQEIHLRMKIGPLNSPLVKIFKHETILFACTKKSLYIFENEKLIHTIDNITFKAVTDACIVNGIVFISSMDGFLVTVKFFD